MAELANILAQVKANEIAQNEFALANQINASLPPVPQIDEDTQRLLAAFLQFCASANVRHHPAAPATCAMFLLSQARVGVAPERIAAAAQAIELLHDHYGLANPIQTRAARWALEQVLPPIEAPRSWPAAEKAQFAHLPVQIRNVIATREQDREKTLRRSQNETAELRRLFKTAAEIKTVDTSNEKDDTTMAKKEGYEQGVGPYSKNDVKMTREPDKGYVKPKDITSKVDPSWSRTDGFSAKLDKGGE